MNKKILIFLLSIIISLVLVEVGLRLIGFQLNSWKDYNAFPFYEAGAKAVYVGYPWHPREFSIDVSYNSLSYPDIEHNRVKPKNTIRILVVGDSYVDATEVPFDQTFFRLLEKRLNQTKPGTMYEVITFGRPGAGPREYWWMLESLGMQFDPDIVIVEFLPKNDIIDTVPQLVDLRAEWGKKTHQYQLLQNQSLNSAILSSRLLSLSALAFDTFVPQLTLRQFPLREAINPEVFTTCQKGPYQDLIEQGWSTTESAYIEMKKIAERHGADFYLVTFTSQAEIEHYKGKKVLPKALLDLACDPGYPDDRIGMFAAKENLHYLNLNPLFAKREKESGKTSHFRFNGHWNETGHTWAAEEIMKAFGKEMQGIMHNP